MRKIGKVYNVLNEPQKDTLVKSVWKLLLCTAAVEFVHGQSGTHLLGCAQLVKNDITNKTSSELNLAK